MASHISPSKMETKASSSTAQDFIDYGDVCRICGSDENSLNLIGIYSNEGLGDDLPTKINTYLPVTVASTDDLPLQCCTKCVSTLNSWHVFVNNSVEADSKWKNFHVLASSSNKLLNEEEGDDGIGDRDDDQSELDDDMPLSELVETKQEPEDDDDGAFAEWMKKHAEESEHILGEHPNCNICGLHFIHAVALKRHMFANHGIWMDVPKGAPSTSKVTKTVVTVESSTKGSKSKTGVKKCSICDFKAENESDFSTHMDSHGRPFVCETCGASFKKKDYLRGHSRTHLDTKARLPHECHICKKRVSTPYRLREHIQTHLDEKPHQCDQCGMTFKLKQTLLAHKNLVHNIENNKKTCEVCGKTCIGNSRLTRHMLSHSDEPQFSCPVCQKRFTRRDSVNKHMLNHGVKERNHECEICNKKYFQRGHLLNHLRTTHKICTTASTSRPDFYPSL